MRVLITGGAGFIGSHIVESLVRDSAITHIRVLDNLSTGKQSNIESWMNKIEFIKGCLNNEKTIAYAVTGIDVIFHEAAIPSVPRSVDNPVENHLNGAHVTMLLLDAAKKAKVRRLVFAASSSAYGDSEVQPKIETMTPCPLSPYAATKLACEHYLTAFAKCFDIDTVSLRYFNVFGPRQDPTSPYSGVIAKFCSAFSANEIPMIFGDGEQSRDFVYITDVVKANIKAAVCRERLGGRVINVGTGIGISLNDIIRALNDITGKDIHAKYATARIGDVKHSLADISAARTLLGYEPQVSFHEGLSATFDWYWNNASQT